jgi:CRP-like cAMP-binding protein
MFTRHHDPIAARLRSFDVSREAADRLSRAGTLIELPAGTLLCEQGERGTQAFLLLEGQVEVLLADQVVTVGPGEVVGEIATLDQHRTRNATVRAATDILVLVYDPATYRSLARDEALRPRLAPQRTAA